MKSRAVVFGAGNIGRGFMGQLLFEAGYQTTFVDVQEALLSALDTAGEYVVRIVGDGARDIRVTNFETCVATDAYRLAQLICDADVLSTAVGDRAFDAVIESMRPGIDKRLSDANAPPLNILLCENIPSAAKRAAEILAIESDRLGLVEASIGRMVPVMTAAQRADDPLRICVEAYAKLPVDGDAIRKPLPALPTLECHSPFQAIIDRKLYVHNMSHAAAAYLGYLRGYEYIWESVSDDVIRDIAAKAMAESSRALSAVYGSDAAELDAHCSDLLRRYGNRALGDQVSRVGGDPMRKLGHADRLIGAMRLCERANTPCDAIAVAAAAAMLYDADDDPTAPTFQAMRNEMGDAKALAEVSGLDEDSAIVGAVLSKLESLSAEFVN